MKKLVMLASVIFAATAPTFAAPLCTSVALSTLTAGGSCEISDKIFSNFVYSGSVAASNVTVSFQSNGPIPAGATIQFSPTVGWSAVSLSFTTSVDLALCPGCVITNALDQIFTPPTPNTVAGSFSHTPAGSPNPISLSGFSAATLSGQAFFSGGPTTVSTTFVQSNGLELQKISSSFSETSTPEPATIALMGAGLLALGLFRRKVA